MSEQKNDQQKEAVAKAVDKDKNDVGKGPVVQTTDAEIKLRKAVEEHAPEFLASERPNHEAQADAAGKSFSAAANLTPQGIEGWINLVISIIGAFGVLKKQFHKTTEAKQEAEAALAHATGRLNQLEPEKDSDGWKLKPGSKWQTRNGRVVEIDTVTVDDVKKRAVAHGRLMPVNVGQAGEHDVWSALTGGYRAIEGGVPTNFDCVTEI